MPMVGKDAKKTELINGLKDIYAKVGKQHNVHQSDFPDLERMKQQLPNHDFTKFKRMRPEQLKTIDMLEKGIKELTDMINKGDADMSRKQVEGGVFDTISQSEFGYGKGEGVNRGKGQEGWIVEQDKYKYDEIFEKLNPTDGKITRVAANSEMSKSKLPSAVLDKIWKLSDVDRDGMMDAEEWALANHLIRIKLDGYEMPGELPGHLVPPSKRE